jgi:hypothetical protein
VAERERTNSSPPSAGAKGRPKGAVARVMAGPFMHRLYPELRLCRSDFELIEAAARAKQKRSIDRRIIAAVLLFVASVFVFIVAFASLRPYWLPGWSLPLLILLVSLVFAVGIASAGREAARKPIRAFLISRGVPLCLGCGYDLRGLDPGDPGRRAPCPECGKPIGEEAAALMADPQPEPPAQ